MEIALYDVNGSGIELNERMHLYKKVGFSAVALNNFDYYCVFNEPLEKIISSAKNAGLNVDDFHSFEDSNDIWREDKVDIYIKTFKKHIDFCATNKIKNITFHASESDTPPEVSMLGILKFNEILEYAMNKNVVVCVENVRSKKHFLYMLENCDKSLKICFDTGHANCYMNNSYKNVFSKYADRVACFHLNDNYGINDNHKFPKSENCTFDWEFFSKHFNFININATLECFPRGAGNY